MSPSMEGQRRKEHCSSLQGETILLWGRDGQNNFSKSFQPRILLIKRHTDLSNPWMLQTRSLPSSLRALGGTGPSAPCGWWHPQFRTVLLPQGCSPRAGASSSLPGRSPGDGPSLRSCCNPWARFISTG